MVFRQATRARVTAIFAAYAAAACGGSSADRASASDASVAPFDAGADGGNAVSDADAPAGDASVSHIDSEPAEKVRGCVLMPQDSFPHADVRTLPIHPRSAEWMSFLGTRKVTVAATLDSSQSPPVRYGQGFNLADTTTPLSQASHYGGYSKKNFYFGQFPLPSPLVIQTFFDRHALVVETDGCVSYEFIGFEFFAGLPRALGAVRWDLKAYGYQPDYYGINVVGWPLVSTLLRADELRAGRIDHALSFVIPDGRKANATTDPPLWPAKRSDGPSTDPSAVPLGAWLRLRNDFDLTAFSPAARTIAEALKRHGMLLGDTGGTTSALMVNIEKSEDWTDANGARLEPQLNAIRGLLTAANFEVIDTAPMRVNDESFQIK